MSLKPPSLWIEQRGRQHRVYWRNGLPGLPARSYVPFYGRAEADQFVGMAGLFGLDTARRVLATDPLEAEALLHAAWAERASRRPTRCRSRRRSCRRPGRPTRRCPPRRTTPG